MDPYVVVSPFGFKWLGGFIYGMTRLPEENSIFRVLMYLQL